ncbi:MAG TPA: DUF1616 domain-containing protein [Candidatus Saccharimonadales bacterium]|nr:DUF1616 domain-containing protein [Candidatus Saccharimonadales bacterium]
MTRHEQSGKSIRRQRGVLLGLFLVVIVGAAIVLGTNLFRSSITEAWSLATSHQPERYTELYFDNPAQLPSYAPAGKSQKVPFTIVNHEAATRTYTYTVQTTIGTVTTSRTVTVTLRNGQAATDTVRFAIPLPNEQAHTTITLLGTNQSLTFRSQS